MTISRYSGKTGQRNAIDMIQHFLRILCPSSAFYVKILRIIFLIGMRRPEHCRTSGIIGHYAAMMSTVLLRGISRRKQTPCVSNTSQSNKQRIITAGVERSYKITPIRSASRMNESVTEHSSEKQWGQKASKLTHVSTTLGSTVRDWGVWLSYPLTAGNSRVTKVSPGL